MDKENRIDHYLNNSDKAELLEELTKKLAVDDPKVIVILIDDREDGSYHSQVMMLGIQSTYEGYGILDVAKQDMQEG